MKVMQVLTKLAEKIHRRSIQYSCTIWYDMGISKVCWKDNDSQLNLPQGTKNRKIRKKTKNKNQFAQ